MYEYHECFVSRVSLKNWIGLSEEQCKYILIVLSISSMIQNFSCDAATTYIQQIGFLKNSRKHCLLVEYSSQDFLVKLYVLQANRYILAYINVQLDMCEIECKILKRIARHLLS